VPKKRTKKSITKKSITNQDKKRIFVEKRSAELTNFLVEKDLNFRQKKFISLYLSENGTAKIQTICESVGVSRQRYYEWMKNPEFKQAIEEGEERLFDLLEEAALELALDGSENVLLFLMKSKARQTRDRKYYHPVAEQQTENKVEIQVTHHYAPQSNKMGQEFNIFSEE
jgi:hypothetical protein